jgi:hypothetical protein
MTRQQPDVHLDGGGVGQVNKKDALGIDRVQTGKVRARGEDMHSAENETKVRPIRLLDDAPGFEIGSHRMARR